MRLSKDIIMEAFETTGLTPIRGTFGDGSVGCGMQAYARAHDRFKGQPRKVSLLEVGKAYFEGFTTGWDGHPALSDDTLMTHYGAEFLFRYLDGIEDGKAAAEAVFAEDRELVTA